MFDDYYSGCTLLKPIADQLGLGIDRLNFVVCQLIALVSAFLMRKFLHPSTTSPTVRHVISVTIGLLLCYFCFGNEIGHLLAISTVSYLVMTFQSTKTMQNTVLVLSIGYLACIHMKRLIYNYGAYNLDITGPLMVMVQRVSGLAFSVHDGMACDVEKLSPFRRKYITLKKPSVLEYYGYVFQFQSILAGPYMLFRDYIQFIDGSNFKTGQTGDKKNMPEPSPFKVVTQKLITSVVCIVIYLTLATKFSIDMARTDTFLHEWSLLKQVGYLLTCTTLTRFMYYHAWILAEAVCNASGLGFSGYDEKGNAKWDIATNVQIIKFEFSDNMRTAISFWNAGTNMWLRFVVYERLEKYDKTLGTFLLSAIWHGFYPGYYICFTTAAIFVSAARLVRRIVRPYFLGNLYLKKFYDCLSFVATKLAFAYFTFPFIMFEFWPSMLVYKNMFFIMHILGVACVLVLPAIRKSLPPPPKAIVN